MSWIDYHQWNNTVAQIQEAKDSGFVLSPELARIGDAVERAIAKLPDNSFARFLGWSYIISLVDGEGFKHPEFEMMARLMVLREINMAENEKFLRGGN